MRRILGVLALLLFVTIPSLALAADISNVTYFGTVRISNNGTAETKSVATVSLNTTSLIAQNLVNASLTNTAIYNDSGADTAYMPGASGNNSWSIWVPSINGPNVNLAYTLYVGGNTSMSSKVRYFPGALGMTTSDNASLELSDNFSVVFQGYINTTAASGNISYKEDAFSLGVSPTVAGNITAGFPGPTGWNNVSSAESTEGQWVTVTYSARSVEQVRFRGYASDINLQLRLHEIEVWNGSSWVRPTSGSGWTNTANSYDGNTATYAYVTLPSAPPNWTAYATLTLPSRITSTQLRFWYSDPSSVYTTVQSDTGTADSDLIVAVTATGVSTGEHTVNVTANSTNLTLYLDGALAQTTPLNGVGVLNNSNSWIVATQNVTPYMERFRIWVGGNLRQDISWSYSSTLPVYFYDAYGNTATPSMRMSGSSANITASLITFSPISQTTSDPTTSAIVADNLTLPFTQPPSMYTELNLSFPGAGLVNELLDAASIPRALFWFPVIFGIINLLGLATYVLSRSLLVQASCMGFLIIVVSLMGGFGYWVVIEYIIMAGAITVASRQYGW